MGLPESSSPFPKTLIAADEASARRYYSILAGIIITPSGLSSSRMLLHVRSAHIEEDVWSRLRRSKLPWFRFAQRHRITHSYVRRLGVTKSGKVEFQFAMSNVHLWTGYPKDWRYFKNARQSAGPADGEVRAIRHWLCIVEDAGSYRHAGEVNAVRSINRQEGISTSWWTSHLFFSAASIFSDSELLPFSQLSRWSSL